MMPGANMKTSTNVMLPMGFIMFALLSFGASQIILLFHTDMLLIGTFRVPSLWMVTHFLILVVAVMVVRVAMYQLVPVAFLKSIDSQPYGFSQFAVTIIDFTSFTLLLGLLPDYAIYRAFIVVVGILNFLYQMFLTIMQ